MQPCTEIRNELSLELNPESRALCNFCGTLVTYIAKRFFGGKKQVNIYLHVS